MSFARWQARMLVRHRAKDTIQRYWSRVLARRNAAIAAATIDGVANTDKLTLNSAALQAAAAEAYDASISPERAQINANIRSLLRLLS
jgi:hypothetical protein